MISPRGLSVKRFGMEVNMKRLIVTAAVLVLLAAAAVTAAGLYGKNQEENAGRTQEAGTAKT